MDREPLRSTPSVSHTWIGYDPDTLEVRDTFKYMGDWYDYQPDLVYKVLPKHLHIDAYKLVEGGEFTRDENKWSELEPKLFQYLRQERNRRLAEVDWVFSTDYQIPDEQRGVWIAYRRALRELPSTTEDPTNPVWPEKPMMPTGETSASTVETDLQSEKSKVVLLQNVVFNLSKRIQALESA